MAQLEITPEALAEKLKSPAPPHLLDVRQPEEFALTALKGSQLIPLGELSARLGELPEGELVVYCHHGGAQPASGGPARRAWSSGGQPPGRNRPLGAAH